MANYLYEGNIFSQADIDAAAKKRGMNADAYISQFGIESYDDEYEVNGMKIPFQNFVSEAKKNNTDVKTLMEQSGIKKKNQDQAGGVGLETGSPSQLQSGSASNTPSTVPQPIDPPGIVELIKKRRELSKKLNDYRSSGKFAEDVLSAYGAMPVDQGPDKVAMDLETQLADINKQVQSLGYADDADILGDLPEFISNWQGGYGPKEMLRLYKEDRDRYNVRAAYLKNLDILYKKSDFGVTDAAEKQKQFDYYRGKYNYNVNTINGSRNENFLPSVKDIAVLVEDTRGMFEKVSPTNLPEAMQNLQTEVGFTINRKTPDISTMNLDGVEGLDDDQKSALAYYKIFDPKKYESVIAQLQAKPGSATMASNAFGQLRYGISPVGRMRGTAETMQENLENFNKGRESVLYSLKVFGRNNYVAFLTRNLNIIKEKLGAEQDENKRAGLAESYNTYLMAYENLQAETKDDEKQFPLYFQDQNKINAKMLLDDPGYNALESGVHSFTHTLRGVTSGLENFIFGSIGIKQPELSVLRTGEASSENANWTLTPSLMPVRPETKMVANTPELKTKVDAIINDDKLSYEDKLSQMTKLVSENPAGFEHVADPEGGKRADWWSLATLYSNVNTLGVIAGYAATGVVGGSVGLPASLASSVPFYLEAQDASFKDRLANGQTYADAWAGARKDGVIMGLAAFVASPLDIVKKTLGKSTSAELRTVVNGLTEAEWKAVTSKYSSQIIKMRNAGTAMLEEGVKMATVFGAGTQIAKDVTEPLVGGEMKSASQILDDGLHAGFEMLSSSQLLLGIGGIRNYKTISPTAKYNMYVMASRPEAAIKSFELLGQSGKLSQEAVAERVAVVKAASDLLGQVPKFDKDGKLLTEEQRGGYLTRLFLKDQAKKLPESMPKEVKSEVDATVAEMDAMNAQIINGKTEAEANTPARPAEPVTGTAAPVEPVKYKTEAEAINSFTNEERNQYLTFMSNGEIAQADAMVAERLQEVAPQVVTLSTIDNVNTSAYSGQQAAALADAKPVMQAISTLVRETTGNQVTLHIHENPLSFSKAISENGDNVQGYGSRGFYMGKDGSIHLNMSKVNAETMVHEGLHPVLDFVAANKPELVKSMYDQLRSLESKTGVIGSAEKSYTGDVTVMKESLTTFISKVAKGEFNINAGNLERVKQFFIDMLNNLGFNIASSKILNMKNAQELRDFANLMSERFKTGEEIKAQEIGADRYSIIEKPDANELQFSLPDQKATEADIKAANKLLRENKKRMAERPEAVVPQVQTNKDGSIKIEVTVDSKGNRIAEPVYAQVPYELQNGALKHISKNKDKAIEVLSDRIVADYNENSPRAEISAAIGWYGKMREWFQKNFGANIETFGQLLAATSARTEVMDNFKQAVDAFRNLSKGKYSSLLKDYDAFVKNIEGKTAEELLAQWKDENPGKRESQFEVEEYRKKLINRYERVPLRSNGKKFNANSKKVLQALYGNWLAQTEGPKTKNFAGNLTGRSYAATIDVWAARYLRRIIYSGNTPRWRILPESEGAVASTKLKSGELSGDYPFAEQVMQRAADKLGIKADDLQAFLWYLEKDVWDKNGWTNATGKRKASFEDGAKSLNTERYQVGVTTYQTAENFDPVKFEQERARMETVIGELGGTIASRVTKSEGEFISTESTYVEPTFDIEFTVDKGTSIDALVKEVDRIQSEYGQEATFISRVVEEGSENARPIIEVGLAIPAEKSAIIEDIKKVLADNNVRGFTTARDSRGNILGIRAQFIPEFESGVSMKQGFERFKNAIKIVNEKYGSSKDISYIEFGSVDTRVKFKNDGKEKVQLDDGRPNEGGVVREEAAQGGPGSGQNTAGLPASETKGGGSDRGGSGEAGRVGPEPADGAVRQESRVGDRMKDLLDNGTITQAEYDAYTRTNSRIRMEMPKEPGLLRRKLGASGSGDFSVTTMDKARRELTDNYRAFVKAAKYAQKIKGDGDIKLSEDPITFLRLINGFDAKFDAVVNSGMITGTGELAKSSTGREMNVEWLFEPLEKRDDKGNLILMDEGEFNQSLKDVVTYMVAERTVELANKFGREKALSGIGNEMFSDVETANNVLTAMNALKNADAIKEAASRYREFADASLQYMVQKGRLADAIYDKDGNLVGGYQFIKANNLQYVAMKRVMATEPGEEVNTEFFGKKSIGGTTEPIKKIKGSEKMIDNPYAALLENTYKAMREADRNEVVLTFRNLMVDAASSGDPNRIADIGEKVDGPIEGKTIKIFVDGKPEYWKLQKDVYNALKGLDSEGYKIPKAITALPALMRWTVTHFPVFAARNVVRDFQSRLILSQGNPWESIKNSITERKNWPEAARMGALNSGVYTAGKEMYYSSLKDAAANITKRGGLVLTPEMAAKAWRAYERMLFKSETTGRVSEYQTAYRQAIKEGMSEYDARLYAATQARALIDFAVGGNTMKVINQLIPFTNAAVQGLRSAAKSVAKNPAGFASRVALFSILPEYMVWTMNQDDDTKKKNYEELPDWQRDMFYNIPIGNNKYIAIPKGFEVSLFGSAFSRGLSYASGNKKAFDGFGGTTYKALMPVDASEAGGPLSKIIEIMANYDFYRGTRIVPPGEENLDPSLRILKEKSSNLSQFLSEYINLDPRYIDHFIKGQFTYFGNTVLKLSNIGEEAGKEKWNWATDTGFVKEYPAYSSKPVAEFIEFVRTWGLSQSPEYKQFNVLAQQYFSRERGDVKEEIGLQMMDFAEQTMKMWDQINIKGLQQEKAKMKALKYGN